MTTTHWLKGSGSWNWAAFTSQPYQDVEVVALMPYAYIDMVMTPQDARTTWAKLIGEGWHTAAPPDGVNVAWVRARILSAPPTAA